MALLSQEGSVIAFSDDARGGSLEEIVQNAFLKGEPAVSIVLPDSGWPLS
jgi:hypothetical protein